MTRLARWFSLALVFSSVAQAATITIDGRDFSAPVSKTILVVRTATTQSASFQGVGTFSLGDGTFIVSLYAGVATYGGFTVSNGVITATTGALTQTGPTSVAAVPSALTPVDLDVGPLSVPAGLETVVLSSGPSGVGRHTGAAAARFYLPDATYKVATYSGNGTFGTFVVQGGAVSNPSGSLTISGSMVGFDRALLAPVRVRTSALTSSASLAVTVRVTDPEGIAVLNGNDPLLYLPDGSYGLKTYSTRTVFGSFAVTNRQVGTITGALTRTADGVGFDLAQLVPVTFSLASLTTPAGGVLYRVSEAPGEGYVTGFGDGSAWFPPGNFVVSDYSTTHPFATMGLTLGSAPMVSGGLQLAAGVVSPRPCGLAVLDLNTTSLAGLRDYSNYVSGPRRISVPPGSYSLVTNTLAPLAAIVVSAALQVTVSNLAPGTSVSAVSCVQDQDGDGVDDPSDNCPAQANASQANLDGDAEGDACDADLDGDGFPNTSDVCPQVADAQADLDLDGQGDACDADDDGDGVNDALDVCPRVANADQIDQDLDGQGNACDADLDGDGAANVSDRCPLIADDQADLDGDGVGDACDEDDDGDDVPDASDNCLGVSNVDQLDADGDGHGNACDADDDADGVADTSDNCALVPNASQLDFDGDGAGDACDVDGDGDGVLNGADLCAATSAGVPIDASGCGGVERVAQRCVQGAFPNHGQYVSCVARESQAAVRDGLITETERARLVAQAAKKR